jgi:hypothetical protein
MEIKLGQLRVQLPLEHTSSLFPTLVAAMSSLDRSIKDGLQKLTGKTWQAV